ncbi:type II secretion system protein GspL [Undibacterium sp. Di24W]|uniref:type II secretion system protein GspL n=1 Tax=Undibacterium sp. Di24W TaxID=3413033 RepID=UPI003BF2C6D7
MASTLYLQLPARAAISADEKWEEFIFPYCLASADKNILQQGKQGLASLLGLVQDVAQLVLMVSASDVTVLKVAVPPMPFAKLKLALPNLLEEQLLTDPAELLFIAAPPVEGMCVVAIVSRAWMEQLARLGEQFPVRKISAYSTITGLPLHAGQTSVLIEALHASNESVDISVCSEDQQVAGFYLDAHQTTSKPDALSQAVWSAVQLLAPQGDLSVYGEPALIAELQKTSFQLQDRVLQFYPADWKIKLASISSKSLDLFSSLQLESKKAFDWLRWRWSLIFLGCAVAVSVFGLNWEWWTLQRESNAIRSSVLAIYKTSFPNETVIRDPLAQMQQKINVAKKLTGQSSNDDFLVLSGLFAQVWDQTVGILPVAGVTTIEYKDRSLYVIPKNIAEVPIERLRAGLKERNLTLDVKEAVLKITVDAGGAR